MGRISPQALFCLPLPEVEAGCPKTGYPIGSIEKIGDIGPFSTILRALQISLALVGCFSVEQLLIAVVFDGTSCISQDRDLCPRRFSLKSYH